VRVADKLAWDREVCAYDARGFGRSSWSPSDVAGAAAGELVAALRGFLLDSGL
jgi:pimeloyl-ACP methyl ester carboxylesterase